MHKYIDNKPAARVKNINEIEEDFQNYQGFVEQLGIGSNRYRIPLDIQIKTG